MSVIYVKFIQHSKILLKCIEKHKLQNTYTLYAELGKRSLVFLGKIRTEVEGEDGRKTSKLWESYKYAHQTVKSTNCRADWIHIRMSTVKSTDHRLQLTWTFSKPKRGILETPKILGSSSLVRPTEQHSGLDSR